MATPANVIAPYKPLPWQLPALRDRSPICLLTGAAGGGKSRTWGEKIHAYCLKYPGAMGLMVRKTRQSMTNSTVLFMERKVIGNDPRVVHVPSKLRFEYANGSILAYGGMADEEQREQIRSIGQDGGLDIVWMEEATRFTEDDFNELLARMRGKAAPWQQIMLSTNPGAPQHWIKRRLIDGKEASIYKSSAIDNPYNPDQYMANLQRLTGIQKLRLVDGQWAQAEGVVYDNWDDVNITEDAEYNPALPVRWGLDDGYSYGQGPGTESYHPRVVLLAQLTAQGGLNIFDEYYRTLEVEEKTLDTLLGPGDGQTPPDEPWRRYTKPEAVWIDSSAAQLKARLNARGIITFGATHPVSEGIKNLRRLICDGSGVRLIKVHPRCVNLVQEMAAYRYDEKSAVAQVGERKPLKMDDHGPDALRYLAWPLRYGV